MNRYLLGLGWDMFEGLSGIYVTEHHLNGWRYFATYQNGQANKQAIFRKLAAGGQKEISSAWDLHHVVEGVHLAPLFSRFVYDDLYGNDWPTVLIHAKEEHHILNSLFRSQGTLDGLQNTDNTPLQGKNRRNYLSTLYRRYQNIYTGDPVLQKVAHNVISNIF